MKNNPCLFKPHRHLSEFELISLLAGATALALFLLTATPAVGAETNRVAAAVFPKSVFNHDDPKGKDPFFPNSLRGMRAPAPGPTPPPPKPGPDLSRIQLRGITGTEGSRVALINSLTFSEGEENSLRIGNAQIPIKVLQIKEKSVVISVSGEAEPREIQLQDRLLPLEQQ